VHNRRLDARDRLDGLDGLDAFARGFDRDRGRGLPLLLTLPFRVRCTLTGSLPLLVLLLRPLRRRRGWRALFLRRRLGFQDSRPVELDVGVQLLEQANGVLVER